MIRLLCPRCDYDVTQTLADRFDACPECGGPVDEDSCIRVEPLLPPGLRYGAYASWPAPVLAALPSVILGDARPLIVLLPLAFAVVYWRWLRVERWLEPEGAWHRSIWLTLTVFAGDFVVSCSVLIVAWVFFGAD